MFKNLIAVPQRDAYDALKKKVEAAKGFRLFPVPLSANATLRIVCHHEQHIQDLLEEREMLLHRDGPPTERTIDFIERRIDESVAAARLLVYHQVFHRLRRLVACVRIQRTMLRLLFAPRPGNVPRISRALIDEGFLVIGNGDGDDDG